MTVTRTLSDFEAAERAFERSAPMIEAIKEADISPMNVEVVSAASVALGVADGILSYRDRIEKLPEFDIRNVDNLKDYATAAWYTHITNLPAPEPATADALVEEAEALRAKLLLWAPPLAASGFFDQEAVNQIKQGSSNKDVPSDVVALVGLYRAKWDSVKDNCAVTEADLERGALIGPTVFSLISQRENRGSRSKSESSLLVRRAWTLLDVAFHECRRALLYLLDDKDAVDAIAPNLRYNPGPRQSSAATRSVAAATNAGVAVVSPAAPPTAPSSATGAPIGGGDSPFAASEE